MKFVNYINEMEIFAQVLTKKKARMKLKKEKNIRASIKKEESMDQGFNEPQQYRLCEWI